MTELILMEELSPNARDQAIIIKNSGGHLLSIINDILDFSKIESGKMEVTQMEYLFHSTVNDVISIINSKLTNPNVQFIAYMERDIPNRLIGDEVRLRQVLINLLNNSIKYTREGRITFDVSWKKTGEDTLLLTLRIKDTGIGIKKADLEKLFSEFQQFDIEKNKNVEGTGLGLAITYNLVKLMGGTISAESTYDLGSIFTIQLPQQYIPTETDNVWHEDDLDATGNSILLTGRTRIENAITTKTMETFKIPGVNILVVDDVPTNLRVAQGLLAPYEATVDICMSGKEAMAAVNKKNYDIVFMDHMMPEMDGLETARTLREMQGGRFADMIIIALSANAIVGAKEMFLQNGLNDFISKPIEIDKLNAMLTKWIPKEKQIYSEPATDTPTTDTKANTIEGINMEKGLRLSGGNKTIYNEILELFHEDIEAKIAQLTNAINDNDVNLYNIYVHALKSACANIGATELSDQASALETAAIKNDIPFITENNPALLEGLKSLQKNIADALGLTDKTETITADTPAYDREALKTALLQLKIALESYDSLAIDETSKTVGAYVKYAPLKEPLKVLLDNVFVGLYPEAVSQIEKLITTG
jgi:CheY-like chemotaxis protein